MTDSSVKVTAGVYKTNFAIYLASRLISDLGSSMFSFALSLYVLDITGSAALFSVIMGFSIFPKVIVNILGGITGVVCAACLALPTLGVKCHSPSFSISLYG